MIKLRNLKEDLEVIPAEVIDKAVVAVDVAMADEINHAENIEKIKKELKPVEDNAKELIKDTAPEEKLMESCHKELKEGMLGQTLQDFIEDCNNLEHVEIWCYDLNEDGPVFSGDSNDIPDNLLYGQFETFDAIGVGSLSINVSEVEEDEDLDESVEEAINEAEEEKKVIKIELPSEHYTELEDIIRVNDELSQKAREGKVMLLREEGNKLLLAEPAINGIWVLTTNDDNEILRIDLV